MEPHKTTFSELLPGNNHFIIPVYQRKYTWHTQQCRTLFDNIIDILESRTHDHFLGTCALAPSSTSLMIIDGQQRITTILLLIKAIQDISTEIDKDRPLRLNRYFYLESDDGEQTIRLEHRNSSDKEAFSYIYNAPSVKKAESQFYKNYIYFKNAIVNYIETQESNNQACALRELFDVVKNNLYLITLTLSNDEDPQIIFQTINSTGVPLEIDELVKNYLLMQPNTDAASSEELYQRWVELEALANISRKEEKNKNYFRKFIRWFVISETQNPKIPSLKEKLQIYEHFSGNVCRPNNSKSNCITKMSTYFKLLKYIDRDETAPFDNTDIIDDDIRLLIRKLNNTGQDCIYPFLMAILYDYLNEKHYIQTKEVLKKALTIFLTYVFQVTLTDQKKYLSQQTSSLFNKAKEQMKSAQCTFDQALKDYLETAPTSIRLYTEEELWEFIAGHKHSKDSIEMMLDDLSDLSTKRGSNLVLHDPEGPNEPPKPKESKDLKTDYIGNVTRLTPKGSSGQLASTNDQFGTQLFAIQQETSPNINDYFNDQNHFNTTDIRDYAQQSFTKKDIEDRTLELAMTIAQRYCVDNNRHFIIENSAIPNPPRCTCNVTIAEDNLKIRFNLSGWKDIIIDKSLVTYRWEGFKKIMQQLAKHIDNNHKLDKWANLPYEDEDKFCEVDENYYNKILAVNNNKEDKANEEYIKLADSDLAGTIVSAKSTDNEATVRIIVRYNNDYDILDYIKNTIFPVFGYSPDDIIFE